MMCITVKGRYQGNPPTTLHCHLKTVAPKQMKVLYYCIMDHRLYLCRLIIDADSKLWHMASWRTLMGLLSRYPTLCLSKYKMTSSNGNISALLALCAENSPVTGEFPSQRPVTRSFGVFFDLRLCKRLSKKSRRRWFETQSRLLWRHCNALELIWG